MEIDCLTSYCYFFWKIWLYTLCTYIFGLYCNPDTPHTRLSHPLFKTNLCHWLCVWFLEFYSVYHLYVG